MLLPTLDSITLVAYRGFRSLELDHLAPVNLVFGPNNSGKTSILEAFSVFCQPLDLRQWISIIRRRDPGGISESRVMAIQWCFPQTREANLTADDREDSPFLGEAEIQAKGLFSAKQLNVVCKEVYGETSTDDSPQNGMRSTSSGHRSDPSEFRRGVELTAKVRYAPDDQTASESLSIFERSPLAFGGPGREPRLPVEFVTASSYGSNQRLIRGIHRIHRNRSTSMLEDVLRVFDPAVEEIDISSAGGLRPTVYLRHAKLGYAPLSAFGTGMMRAVFLLAAAFQARGGILLLDEIETGIHFSALKAVMNLLIEAASLFEVQVVAATHSLDAIDAFVEAKASRERIAAYRLPPQDSGRPVARFSGADLYRMRRSSGLEVR